MVENHMEMPPERSGPAPAKIVGEKRLYNATEECVNW